MKSLAKENSSKTFHCTHGITKIHSGMKAVSQRNGASGNFLTMTSSVLASSKAPIKTQAGGTYYDWMSFPGSKSMKSREISSSQESAISAWSERQSGSSQDRRISRPVRST